MQYITYVIRHIYSYIQTYLVFHPHSNNITSALIHYRTIPTSYCPFFSIKLNKYYRTLLQRHDQSFCYLQKSLILLNAEDKILIR